SGAGTVIVSGVTLTNATNAPTVMVNSGDLMLRDVMIKESTAADQWALQVTGGNVDLGTKDSPGGVRFDVQGSGKLISNTGGAAISMLGDTFAVDGVALPSSYRVEDMIQHGMDAGGGGIVTWAPGEVFVPAGGSIQRAVDAAAAGTTINVEAGGSY